MFDSGPCDWLVLPLLLPTPTNLGRLRSDPKFRNFRNGDISRGNCLGKVPENPEIVEFLKSESFNRKFRKFRDESQMEWKFPGKIFENLGIPHEVVLFFGIYANS